MKYLAVLVALLLASAVFFLFWQVPAPDPAAPVPQAAGPSPPPAAHAKDVQAFCSLCHAYPPPDTFPKAHWPLEVRRGYHFFFRSGRKFLPPDAESVTQYYLHNAPDAFPDPKTCPLAASPLCCQFQTLAWSPASPPAAPNVTHVHLAPLFTEGKLAVLVSHAHPGKIWAVKPYEHPPAWTLLADVHAPARVDVVDLNGDGIQDVLVADMGHLEPTDGLYGRVLGPRGEKNGAFTPQVLLEGVGRVTDVRAADFNGDGLLDLAVAVFGWQQGQVLWLENRTKDWAKPVFHPTVLDQRSGAIQVPVGDINGDGRPDIVALLSQEHETVMAYVSDGRGGFTPQALYKAPHPAYGSSSLQLVDLDRDGDLDVLYTNGDSLDPPFLLKPYHSVQWLENRGKFPFVHHHITAQYGVMQAVAADIDGDGRLEILAVSHLPDQVFPDVKAKGIETVQLLDQVAPGVFERHVLARGKATHVTCAVGDLFGDGHLDLVLGNYVSAGPAQPTELLTIWKNLGRKKRPAG